MWNRCSLSNLRGQAARATNNAQQHKGESLVAAIHKALMRRFYEEVVNQGKLEVIEQILAPNFLDHNPPAPGLPAGAAGVRASFQMFRAAFPDVHFEVEDMVSEVETVC